MRSALRDVFSRYGGAPSNLQRRLLRAFARSGGDLGNDAELTEFVRHVEAALIILPSKIATAVEMAWRTTGSTPYVRLSQNLSEDEGAPVSPAAVRQRVSRGARLLEALIARGAGKRALVPRRRNVTSARAGPVGRDTTRKRGVRRT